MEILLALAAALGVIYLGKKRSSAPSSPPAPAPSPQPQPQPSPGSGPTPQPTPTPAPTPSGPRPPGVYPPGTVGTFPISLSIRGGDGGWIEATPGGKIYIGETATFWYGPGTWVAFRAIVDTSVLGGIGTAFDHWEGPNGVTSRENPIREQILGPGFVHGVFAWLGFPGL